MTDLCKKYNGICTPETMTATRLNIEIPINKLTSATYNKDGIVNCLRPVPGCYPDETSQVGRADTRSWHGSLLAE